MTSQERWEKIANIAESFIGLNGRTIRAEAYEVTVNAWVIAFDGIPDAELEPMRDYGLAVMCQKPKEIVEAWEAKRGIEIQAELSDRRRERERKARAESVKCGEMPSGKSETLKQWQEWGVS